MHSKIRRYSAHLTEPNEYLSVFWGLDATNKCFWGELNKIILRSTPNGWDYQAFLHLFYFESVPF